ncbi:UL51 protein [Suid alphaherpesvirus 1]|uniref:UL51 protein n=1 Tax=Suid herpesvirus 1 TaxID=10345 RepID=A0A172XDL8_SUHV|nr:UL51 protein [Suid alphaherpesvirus 1]
MLGGIFSGWCGRRGRGRAYEPPDELRLRESLAVLNVILPAPLAAEDVMASAEAARRLARADTLARTYQACQRNLECLARHEASGDDGLDAVVAAHAANARRLADTCLAALMHLYLSVGAVDAAPADLVEQARRMPAETPVVMSAVAVLERTLGLARRRQPAPVRAAPAGLGLPVPAQPAPRATAARPAPPPPPEEAGEDEEGDRPEDDAAPLLPPRAPAKTRPPEKARRLAEACKM